MNRAQWLILGCTAAAAFLALYRVNQVSIRLGMNAAFPGGKASTTA